jgi:hypothetical protein
MIKKSLLTALAILLAYHFTYPHLSKRFYRVNGQQRQNFDRAQAYVFGPGREKHVVIGSSMSWELNADVMGADWRKLSFPGCSVLTAFEIMRKSGKYPAVLLVETNQCFWDANGDILNDVFNPVMAPPRRHSPIFLEEARPSNFVAGIAEAFVRNGCKAGSALAATGDGPTAEAKAGTQGLSPEMFEKILKHDREQMDLALPQGPLDARVKRIGEHVDFLRSKGCICILFEMPIHPSLTDLKIPATVRSAMQARFPRERYDWLAFDKSGTYQTSDGIHLRYEDAERLTGALVQQVGEIVSKHDVARTDGIGGMQAAEIRR